MLKMCKSGLLLPTPVSRQSDATIAWAATHEKGQPYLARRRCVLSLFCLFFFVRTKLIFSNYVLWPEFPRGPPQSRQSIRSSEWRPKTEAGAKSNDATIAQWIRLRLPSCRPGFESQAHHLCFFQFILFKLYICHLNWNVKRTKINKKRPGLAHF